MTSGEATGLAACVSCGTEVRPADRFCGNCGNTLADPAKPPTDAFSILTPSFAYYFVTLALLAVYKFTELFSFTFASYTAVTIIDVLIVIIFASMAWKTIRPLLSFSGFRFSIAAVTVIGALAACLVVSFVADYINISLFDGTYSDRWLFEETSSPMLFAVLLTCLQPAIFEEVAFRGFLFNNIQKISTPLGTVYITAFIFGIIHLAVISLLWLVPLGIVFALLRMKYNTLWYGMIGHFTYNLGFVLLDFWEGFGMEV